MLPYLNLPTPDRLRTMADTKSNAGVAKLVDARALGARGAILGGSSPLPGTNEHSEYSNLSDFDYPGINIKGKARNLSRIASFFFLPF